MNPWAIGLAVIAAVLLIMYALSDDVPQPPVGKDAKLPVDDLTRAMRNRIHELRQDFDRRDGSNGRYPP